MINKALDSEKYSHINNNKGWTTMQHLQARNSLPQTLKTILYHNLIYLFSTHTKLAQQQIHKQPNILPIPASTTGSIYHTLSTRLMLLTLKLQSDRFLSQIITTNCYVI